MSDGTVPFSIVPRGASCSAEKDEMAASGDWNAPTKERAGRVVMRRSNLHRQPGAPSQRQPLRIDRTAPGTTTDHDVNVVAATKKALERLVEQNRYQPKDDFVITPRRVESTAASLTMSPTKGPSSPSRQDRRMTSAPYVRRSPSKEERDLMFARTDMINDYATH